MSPIRRCRTRYCDGWSDLRFGLCPSCRFIGKAGLFVGALLAGAVAWLLR